MPLVHLILVLVLVGVALWVINTYVPMAPPVKTILNVVVVLILVLWLLGALFPGLGTLRIGRAP